MIIIFLLLIIIVPLKTASQKERFSIVGDVDNDGHDEELVVLEKRGYYGDDLPFWLDENIDDYGNHLFVYKMETPEPELQWASSTISYDVYALEIIDIDNDGKNDLVVNDGQVIMEWRNFGFFEK